jgi:hypothetical protein
MNAIFRRIDLAMAVLIPLAVGQVMTFASLLTSAIFICGFSIAATIVEYYILWKVYEVVPSLATKTKGSHQKTEQNKNINGLLIVPT